MRGVTRKATRVGNIIMTRIDILTVIDAENIVTHWPDAGNPPEIPYSLGSGADPDPYVHMFASVSHVRSGQGTSELHVKAKVGDTFSWTLICLSPGMGYSVLFENVWVPNYPAGNDKDGCISVPERQLQPETISSDPTNAQSFQQTAYTATALHPTQVIQDGVLKIAYRIRFRILDGEGKNRGLFDWDPFITVEALR